MGAVRTEFSETPYCVGNVLRGELLDAALGNIFNHVQNSPRVVAKVAKGVHLQGEVCRVAGYSVVNQQ